MSSTPPRLYLLASKFPRHGATPHWTRHHGVRAAVDEQASGRVCHPTTSISIFESAREPDDLLRTILFRNGDLVENEDRLLLIEITGKPVAFYGLDDSLVFPRFQSEGGGNPPELGLVRRRD